MAHKKRNHLWLGFPCFLSVWSNLSKVLAQKPPSDWMKFWTTNQKRLFKWFLRLKLSTKPIVPHGGECKIMPERSLFSCVPFCLRLAFLAFWNMKSTLCWFSSTICRRGLNQAAAGMQSAFGSMGQQVQKAAMSAAADAAAKEVTNQLSNALSGGGRRK